MSRLTTRKDLSLKALELFQVCAQQGSLQAAAQETGLSMSTVSHHLRGLESHLGVPLFDHTRRPMVLTPKGRAFLDNIDGALLAIRRASAEAATGDAAGAGHLRIGAIEDFDSDIIPQLAVQLARRMPHCDFTYHTDSSHTILDLLRNRHLDLGVTTLPDERTDDLQTHPLLRDPFVVVLPKGKSAALPDMLAGHSALPFLRFTASLMIGRQIEAQLQRMRVALPHRFACANNQTLMAMVAAHGGWTITTPLLFARAKRFHADVEMHPFPGKRFARTLAVIATPDCATTTATLIAARTRQLIAEQILHAAYEGAPWLEDGFHLIGVEAE